MTNLYPERERHCHPSEIEIRHITLRCSFRVFNCLLYNKIMTKQHLRDALLNKNNRAALYRTPNFGRTSMLELLERAVDAGVLR